MKDNNRSNVDNLIGKELREEKIKAGVNNAMSGFRIFILFNFYVFCIFAIWNNGISELFHLPDLTFFDIFGTALIVRIGLLIAKLD